MEDVVPDEVCQILRGIQHALAVTAILDPEDQASFLHVHGIGEQKKSKICSRVDDFRCARYHEVAFNRVP